MKAMIGTLIGTIFGSTAIKEVGKINFNSGLKSLTQTGIATGVFSNAFKRSRFK